MKLPIIGLDYSGKNKISATGRRFKETSRSPFAVHFKNYLRRIRHLHDRLLFFENKIDDKVVNGVWDIDRSVYQDLIIVLLRSIIGHHAGKTDGKNYTYTCFLSRQLLATENDKRYIERLLNQELFIDSDGKVHALWDAILIVADKSLCHFDNYEQYNLDGEIFERSFTWTPSDIASIKDLLFKNGKLSLVGKLVHRMEEVVMRLTITETVAVHPRR